jgi:hypothetical protein
MQKRYDLVNYKVKQYIKETYSDYEMIGTGLGTIDKDLDEFTPVSSIVIVNVCEHFDYPTYQKEDTPFPISTTVRAIHKFANKFKNKTVIVIQMNKFTNREFSQLPSLNNLHVLEISSIVFYEYEEYKKLTPVVEKNFDSKRYIQCLNNKARPHRVGVVMYLLHRQLDSKLTMSLLSKEAKEETGEGHGHARADYNYMAITSWAKWNDNKIHNSFKRLNETNFNNFPFIVEHVYYDAPINFDSYNFNRSLRKHYRSTFIDIVTESTGVETSFLLTEKYINSVYGVSFPILIASQGAISAIRDLGFDVFDDIINHGYDDEINPFYRIKKAIDWNYKLLTDGDRVKKLWKENQHRFQANIDHHRNNLFNLEYSKLTTNLDQIREELLRTKSLPINE